MTDIRLSASIACADPLEYRESIRQLDQAGLDAYHFDMCDGHFAPTFLLSPGLLRALRQITSRRFDVHLYCTHPSRYLDELAQCGADVVVIHVEAEEDFRPVIRQIRQKGLLAGLAILPDSPVPSMVEEVLPELNLLIANMVGPAYAGQPFDPRGLVNLACLNQLVQARRLPLEIAADGHVAVEHLEELLQAGCNHLVCGTSSIFKPGLHLGDALQTFRQKAAAASQNLGPNRHQRVLPLS